jgi:tetratricopeptide (TPR) repeat protein
MTGTRRVRDLATAAALGLLLASTAIAQAPAAQDPCATPGKQPYTIAEYNAYQACAAEKDPKVLLRCLDDFESKYPNSNLNVYIFPLYYRAFNAQRNFPKVMEYSDKLVALSDQPCNKPEPAVKYEALFARAYAYTTLAIKPTDKDAKDQATKARDAAISGLKSIGDLKKPDNVSDDDFNKQKNQSATLFNYTAGNASMTLKDYPAAIGYFKAVLALNPDDAISNYQLGTAYHEMTPPQMMNAFWYFARAVTSKGANEAQAKSVQAYLRRLIASYQGGNVCDSLTDAELNELLQLAKGTADRPASYTLASNADLEAARKDMTIASVLADLKVGGDKGKITWLASCGLEFPEVPAKVIEIVPGDSILFKLAFVTSEAEFEAATTANMDIKVAGQPDAARVEKDSAIHFTGTLASYDPDPAFMVHWDKAKIKEEDIPKAKEQPKKPVRRTPKKPGT